MCAALLAFPVLTLWRLVRDLAEMRQVVPPGAETGVLAALEIGIGLEQLLCATSESRSTPTMRRTKSETDFDGVGSSFRARRSLVARRAFSFRLPSDRRMGRCYTTPEEMLSSIWQELRMQESDDGAVARSRSAESVAAQCRQPPCSQEGAGRPSQEGAAGLQPPGERRRILSVDDMVASRRLSVERLVRRLGSALESSPDFRDALARRLSDAASNASERAVAFDLLRRLSDHSKSAVASDAEPAPLELETDTSEDSEVSNAAGPAEAAPRPRAWQEPCSGALRAASVLGVFALMVALGVVNKVLFRMVLAPAGRYTHTLSCSTNLAYLCYSWGAVLLWALRGSEEQRGDLRTMAGFARRHWDLFASIGVCESVAFTLLPLVTPRLPKVIVPLVSQAMLPISMLLNALLLGRSYSPVQVVGVAVAVSGIYVASADGGGLGPAAGLGLGELALPLCGSVLAYFFLASSFVLKDVAFVLSAGEGCRLHLVFVEGAAALGQCAALALQWPMNFVLLTDLPPRAYFQAAREAFFGAAGLMPGLLVCYWVGNILYRLATLRAVRQLSSLATMLANLLTVPVTSLAFCLPLGLPLLGPPEACSPRLVGGLLLLCLGLAVFNGALVRGAYKQFRAHRRARREGGARR